MPENKISRPPGLVRNRPRSHRFLNKMNNIPLTAVAALYQPPSLLGAWSSDSSANKKQELLVTDLGGWGGRSFGSGRRFWSGRRFGGGGRHLIPMFGGVS